MYKINAVCLALSEEEEKRQKGISKGIFSFLNVGQQNKTNNKDNMLQNHLPK